MTSELLDKIFNSTHTPNKTVSASFLRKKVFSQYNLLLDLLDEYYRDTVLPQEQEIALERMKLLVKPSAPYSAFLSWCILEDDELCPLLKEFIGVAE
ncbi:hypothetical protein ACSZME_02635 [Aeromonas dhakensis]